MADSVNPDSFEHLIEHWQDVLNHSSVNHVFLTRQWQQAWWQALGRGYKQRLLSINHGNELVGIAPLKQEAEKLSFIGSGDVCDYMDFIVKKGQEDFVFLQLIKYIEPLECNTIELESLLPQSLALKYFIPLARLKGWQVEIEQTDVSPRVSLPSTWEDYLAFLKSKDRHELQRKERRLAKTMAANTYTLSDKAKIATAMDSFFQLFSLSGPEKAGFMNDKRKEFFKTMSASLAENNNIRLSFMEIGGKATAASLCFDYENDIYLYNSAYDPAFAGLSVSLLLEAACIREAIGHGKKRFDFLRGNEAYKYDLGGQDVQVYRAVISRS
jgi:CelD/BcsL family acetyltransferase involved in cellulose biosynthesis